MPHDPQGPPPAWQQDGHASAPPPGAGPEAIAARVVAARAGADRVALVLTAGPGHRAVVRGSDPVLVALGDMVQTVGQGPSHELLATGAPCSVPDLHALGHRWPVLASTFALPPQLRAMLLVPLAEVGDRTGPDAVFGALVLSRDHPRPFTSEETTAAARGAELISMMLMARALRGGVEAGDDALDAVLDPRTDLLDRAVGALMHRRGLDADEADRRLHTIAFAAGRTLYQAAADLLDEQH